MKLKREVVIWSLIGGISIGQDERKRWKNELKQKKRKTKKGKTRKWKERKKLGKVKKRGEEPKQKKEETMAPKKGAKKKRFVFFHCFFSLLYILFPFSFSLLSLHLFGSSVLFCFSSCFFPSSFFPISVTCWFFGNPLDINCIQSQKK